MPTTVPQARFRAPRNLDLDSIDGLGDAIADIRNGVRRQRALESLAQLGIVAARRKRQLEDERNFERKRIAFAQRESERLDKDDAISVDALNSKFGQRQRDSTVDDPVLDEARAAIQLGAPRRMVMQRLRLMGIDPERLA